MGLIIKRIFLVVSLAGYALAPACVFYLASNPSLLIDEPVQDSAPLTVPRMLLHVPEKTAPSQIPVRITIPSIQVSAPIEEVGLTSQGAVDIPKGPSGAAWFNQGPRPGETGSSVIVGHFGWRDGIPAVFDKINLLQKGDSLSIEGQDGTSVTFVVRELRTYGQNESAPDVFISTDGKAHLNLITCHGDWSQGQQSYSNRLVVFTDKE